MAQKFKIRDLVVVRPDEGLDTPREMRVKLAKIKDYVGDLQTKVIMQDGQQCCACEYHLRELPRVKRLDLPEVQVVNLLELDPELHARVIDAQKFLRKYHEIPDLTLTTALFVLAWSGVARFDDDPDNWTKGSGIFEVVK